MNIIRNILGRVFAFWATIVFLTTMFIFAIPVWATGIWPEPRRTALFHPVARIWMRIFLFLSGIRIVIRGREHFEKGRTYVVVSNHNSFMDVPMTTPFIPGPNKTIAKIEMSRIPLFGMIYKRGSVLVDRKSEDSRRNSFVQMMAVLGMGMHMCIYPEGTRNKTKEPLQHFHSGAFRLAIDANKPVMPVVIFNTAKVLPVNKTFFFWPVKIRMYFLEPVSPEGLTADQLRLKIFEIMKDFYTRHIDQ